MIKPKKSLGQNFLKSKPALESMVSAGNISPEDTVLEIGPGKGVLTEKILVQAKKVIAVEKDDRLIPELLKKFSQEISEGKLEIIHGDILDLEPEKILPKVNKYKIIANIPYYITGTLLRKFLSGNFQPERMVLLLQKEVAKRIVARDGKESLLSLSVKVYGEPKYMETVKAKYFSPEPKVDSAIVLIKDISKNFFKENKNKISEENFFEILKAGFAHKRKVLISNLKSLNSEKNSKKNLEEIFDMFLLSRKVRAEDLKLEDWRKLAEVL